MAKQQTWSLQLLNTVGRASKASGGPKTLSLLLAVIKGGGRSCSALPGKYTLSEGQESSTKCVQVEPCQSIPEEQEKPRQEFKLFR